ncbi:HEPN-associated N-terminal domain-containing protein [Microbacterium sp. Mcb102]|uniref:HEPN-associated N-terminal domain-containing protein n=1 Tax=Microbacterium sp. Mcb102 TaxID=2926012 RepID=UPI0021C5FFB1|nr:HEPN-associated N-terminal domain-containing protein [Microbacterium sp. Mcb102]
MGMAKDMQMAEEEQGWSYSEKQVCERCVADPSLADAVATGADAEEVCDFCGKKGAAALDVLLDAFVRGVSWEYTDADSALVPWDGREGGYQARTYDRWELVDLFVDAFAADGLAEAVADSLADVAWASRDWAWRDRDVVLNDAWAAFSDQVKYRTRYVIWLIEDDASRRETRYTGEIPVGDVLHDIGRLLDELAMLTVIPAGSSLWRAQIHSTDSLEPMPNASRLGTSPREYAKQPNRMSPAGIPMFYGALDKQTALDEVVRHNLAHEPYATLGAFALSSPITVVDFDRLPEEPTIFHPTLGYLRREIAFLHKFVKEMSAPVAPGDEGIEYVPTQVVTEFFLRVLQPASGATITGLAYASAVRAGGRSVVIDIPHENCLESADPTTGHEPALVLDPASVQRVSL